MRNNKLDKVVNVKEINIGGCYLLRAFTKSGMMYSISQREDVAKQNYLDKFKYFVEKIPIEDVCHLSSITKTSGGLVKNILDMELKKRHRILNKDAVVNESITPLFEVVKLMKIYNLKKERN